MSSVASIITRLDKLGLPEDRRRAILSSPLSSALKILEDHESGDDIDDAPAEVVEQKPEPRVVGLLGKPVLGDCDVSLRNYQNEAIAAIEGEFARGKKSTLMVLPTGTGKTITFGKVVRNTIERGGRALILAHRGELIDQAGNTLDLLGVEAAIEKADSYARALYEPDAVIATVQTMKGNRLAEWPRDHFRLIVTDEAHHATADSYRRIYKHFNTALHLGVTATADRADEDELSDVFESLAYEYPLWEAMNAEAPGPYLCRLKVVQCDVNIDLRDIRTTAGDFNQADLEERITPLIDVLANTIRQEIGNRRTIVFTPDVGSAQAMATALASLGIVAEWVSGDDNDRKRKIKQLKDGKIQVLANCALLTEGFDAPPVAAIVLCRPTKSRPLYAQMIGRGTRISPGKEDCLIIDFNWLTGKHKLVKPVELFDTTHTDQEVMDIASDLLSKEKGLDLVEAVKRAENQHKERQILRIKARERDVKYRRVSYDPISVYDTMGLAWRGKSPDQVINKATPGQVNALKNGFKVEGAENMSRSKASTLLDYLSNRRKLGLATMKQVSWLIANNVEPDVARNMTIQQASDQLDTIWGKSKRA